MALLSVVSCTPRRSDRSAGQSVSSQSVVQATADNPLSGSDLSAQTKSDSKTPAGANSASELPPPQSAIAADSPGAVQQVSVTAGPFDIHRKYRSMEGPYVTETVRISDLLAKRNVAVGEDRIKFVEDGHQTTMAASVHERIISPSDSNVPKELIWLTGVKLVVLDENDRVLPTSEFICHCNVDLDKRDEVFPEIHTGSNRLFTITQGQTDIHFPAGCAVPLVSDEYIHIKFQAANRTTSAHRRVKHLCTIDLVRDADLKTPMKALSWYTPFMAVELNGSTRLVSEAHGASCLALSSADNAPNAIPGTIIDYAGGRKVTGHWKVPPGEHLYVCPLTKDRDFGLNAEDRVVRTVWTHCHPLCKKVTMLVCDGNKKTPLWTVDVTTKTDSGLETKKISDLYFKQGVVMPRGRQFEIDAVYDNTTGVDQDSMVSQGIFYEEPKFVKPNWQKHGVSPAGKSVQCTDIYCGIRPPQSGVRNGSH